jgi:hypothetical protein
MSFGVPAGTATPNHDTSSTPLTPPARKWHPGQHLAAFLSREREGTPFAAIAAPSANLSTKARCHAISATSDCRVTMRNMDIYLQPVESLHRRWFAVRPGRPAGS